MKHSETTDTPVLETRQLGLQVAGRQLVTDLNMTLHAGQSLAVLGQNGSGKTTLLHTLMRFRAAQSGEIRLCGRKLEQWRGRDLARHTGIVFQQHNDEMPATVMETVLLGRYPHSAPWQWEGEEDRRVALEALQAMALEHLADRQINSLSGGERQRLALATLLSQNPTLLLLDEPGNHLDVAFQIRSLSLLREHLQKTGTALIMATHDINLAARFCQQVLLLDGNGHHELGPTEETLTEARLSKVYSHPIRSVQHEGRTLFYPA